MALAQVNSRRDANPTAPRPETFSGARALRTTNQSISGGSATALSFESVEFDTDGYWSAGNPTRFTAPRTGVYIVTGHFKATRTGGSAGTCSGSARKNGLSTPDQEAFSTNQGSQTTFSVENCGRGTITMTAGDYIEFKFSGGSFQTYDVVGEFGIYESH